MAMKRLLAFGLAFALAYTPLAEARAQSATPVTPIVAGKPISGTNPMPITGVISATIGGFTPSTTGARMTPLAVTTADSSGTLPTGTVVIVSNVGANPMYCNVNGVAATVSDQLVTASGGWFSFTIPVAITTLHCIATGGATTANGLGGAGVATGTGGGSGGGGGGSVTQGTVPWVVSGQGTAGSAATGVVTVQGIASMTPLLVNPGTAANWGVGATAAATPANAQLVGMAQGGNLTGLTGTSGNLNVQCANCSGSGVSTADQAAFTAGSSLFAGTGGFFQTTATSNPLTNGQQGMLQLTATRAAFVNPRNSSGTEVFTTGAPGQVGAPAAAFADGAIVTLGTKADTACGTAPCSTNGWLAQLHTDVTSPVPPGTAVIGYTSTDPCTQQNVAKTNIPIATSSGNVQLLAGVSAKKIYICSLFTIGATASVQNIIEGTGAACTTANEAAVIGSTTAASGMSFAANGGFTYGNGGGTIAFTATAANGICLLQSGTAAIAGNATVVQQ